MKKVIIHENQRGLLFKNGRFVRLLGAGKYHEAFGRKIEVNTIDDQIYSQYCDIDTLLENKEIASLCTVAEVGDCQLALHFENGRFIRTLSTGKYAFWNISKKHEFELIDMTQPEVDASIPEYIFKYIPVVYYKKVEVAPYQKALVYFNKKLTRVLDEGIYYFWKHSTDIDVEYVDTRLRQMNIVGQEILTKDKVTLRVNFVCNYRITDCIRIREIENPEEMLHVSAQLALREYIGRYRFDEILENKEAISQFIFEKLKEKEQEYFVEISDAGVKDIILPGEIREIMNTVLVAEKQAQASVITRREEVASTRSLLNTAKLMDENRTLYKLKELEYIERISCNIGNINLNGNGGLISQLAGVLRGDTQEE